MIESKTEGFCEGCIARAGESGSGLMCLFEQDVNKLITSAIKERKSNRTNSISPSQSLSTLTQTARRNGCTQLSKVRRELGPKVHPTYGSGFRKIEVSKPGAPREAIDDYISDQQRNKPRR